MAEEALLKALEDDARAQCEHIIREAEEEAARIIREAGEEASRMKVERTAELQAELRKKRAAAVNRARIRAGAVSLKARHEAIEDVIKEALLRVESLPREEYKRLLNSLAGEIKGGAAVERFGCEPQVRVNPADAGLLNSAPQDIVPDASVRLGVVLSSPDGRIRCENTVLSRLDRARKRILPELDRILFG